VTSDFTPGESVKICIQSSESGRPNRTFPGVIEDFRRKQLLLIADEEVPGEAEISARTKHLIYLGNVLNSFARPDGKWEIAVTVSRRLATM